MGTFRTSFDDPFELNLFLKVTGTYAVSNLPNRECRLARIKMYSTNAGSIFFGGALNTGTFPMPWQMEASYDTGWFSIGNLNQLYYGQSSGTSYFGIWYQK